MFWDKAAGFYDFFVMLSNGKVNRELAVAVAERIKPEDRVLECACGTGMLSKAIAPKCKELIATDFSAGMLRQTQKNCGELTNIKIKKADIMQLKCADEAFDKVVAGNVIHLLDSPQGALAELMRVCKTGGKVIIPTYISHTKTGKPHFFVRLLKAMGIDFKKQFDFAAYQEFFRAAGCRNVEYTLIEGKTPCAIAVITKMGERYV